MKIAIISDTHDNLANLKKAVSFIEKEKIKTIIHCGDVTNLDTLKKIFSLFEGKIYLALGNADNGDLRNFPFQKIKNLKIFKEFGELKIDKKKIAFCHFPKEAYLLAKNQRYDIVFYGHLHKVWIKNVGKTKLVNPGELAGMFFKPTFTIYDLKTGKLELKILEKLK